MQHSRFQRCVSIVFLTKNVHDDDQLSEIKQIRRLTQAARSSNTGGSGSGGSSGGSGRTIRGSLLQLIEPNISAGVTSSSNRDLMDPISG